MGRDRLFRKPAVKKKPKGAPRVMAPVAELPDYVLGPKAKAKGKPRKPLSEEQKARNKLARQKKAAAKKLAKPKAAPKRKVQRGGPKKMTGVKKISWPRKVRNKQRALALKTPSFRLAGGTCFRATKMVADKGTYDPVRYLIDALPAFYNVISGLYCFSQYGNWFIANDYREGVPVMAQNPNTNRARHPLKIKSPWYFLSAKPDPTFKLEVRPYKGIQKVIDKEPQVRPIFYNKCSGRTLARVPISDDEMSEDGEELWEKKQVVKMALADDRYYRRLSIKALKRTYREEKKRQARLK